MCDAVNNAQLCNYSDTCVIPSTRKSIHMHSTKDGQRYAESGYDVSQTFITTFTCVYVSTLSESTLQRSF
jgi:hypothetical protein